MPSVGGGLRTVVPPQEILVFDEVDGKPTLYYAMEGNNAIGSTYLGFTWERNSYFPTAEDFDGDGLEEQLRWSPNETSFGMVGFDAAGNVVYAPFVVNLVSQDPAFQTGDFNGDGRADILALDRHGGISGNEIRKELRTLQLNDDGTVQKFRIISDFPLDGEGYDLGYTHDLNLDGRDELVFEAEGMLVSFQFSDSLDSFNGTTLTNLESDSRLSFGDFDGDDLGEIVIVQRATGALAMLHLDAAGRVADRVELAPPTGPVAIYRYPLDWDGDGRDDLEMIRNPDAANPTFEIQRFDGQGLFAGPAVVVANLPGIPRSGVFTNDGRPSLLFAEPGAALRLILLRPDLQIDRTLSSENVLPGEIQVLTGDYTRD
jgi:hypothetical protein